MAWDFGRMGAGAVGGAATGAAIGSIIPGVGTAIGAGLGGLIGIFAGTSAAQENERAEAARKSAQAQRDSMLEKLAGIADQQNSWYAADRARRDAMIDRLTNQANPYSQGNPGLMNMLALQQGSIARGFDRAEEDIRRSLASRGALGTAQETSLMRRLALDEVRAMSGAEASLRADAYDKAQNYDIQRNSQLAELLGMLSGNTGAGIYQGMAGLYQQDAGAAQARGDRADQMLGSFIGPGIGAIPFLGGMGREAPVAQGARYSGINWGA